MQDDKLLSLQEVAQQTGMSEKTIRRWIKSGELPAIELGGRYRIARSDLQEFLSKHKKQFPRDDKPSE